MASPLEQAALELQAQLDTTREQLRIMAESHDGLKSDYDKLKEIHEEAERNRTAAETALNVKMAEITS